MKLSNILKLMPAFLIACLLISFASAVVANNDKYASGENGIEVNFPGYLSNDVISGDDFWANLVDNTFHGSLDFTQYGKFAYIPTEAFHGVDYFTYYITNNVSDEFLDSNTAYVIIGVNDAAPIAVQDKYSAPEGTYTILGPAFIDPGKLGVLENDSDADDDTIYAYLSQDVHNGTLDFNLDGTFSYTANSDKPNGVDFFKYYASDLYLDSDSVYAIFVIGNNTAPTATADVYSYDLVNDTFEVNATDGVLVNDSDAEGDILFAKLVDDSSLNGTLDFNEDGSFIYTPSKGFSGLETFTYYATDLDLNSETVSVKILVNYTEPAPIVSSVATGGSANIGGGSCTTDWTLGEWSTCVNGTQTRTVSYPTGYCAPVTLKPVETQTCIVPPVINNQTVQANGTVIGNFVNGITGAVIGGGTGSWIAAVVFILIIAGLLYWVILRRKSSNKK